MVVVVEVVAVADAGGVTTSLASPKLKLDPKLERNLRQHPFQASSRSFGSERGRDKVRVGLAGIKREKEKAGTSAKLR